MYHTPPGYPAVAGALVELGERLDLEDPGHPGQLVSAVVGRRHAVLLVLLLARTLWPARPVVWLAAVGLLRVPPDGPEDGSDVPSRAARDARDGRRAPRPRAHGSRAAVPVAARGPARATPRARPARSRVVAVDGGGRRRRPRCRRGDGSALRQAGAHGARGRGVGRRARSRTVVRVPGDAVFEPGLQPPAARRVPPRAPSARVLRRRAGSRRSFGRPWSGRFDDRFWPVLYAETWGDYFGIWSWGPGRAERTDAIDATLGASERRSGCCRRHSRWSESWRFSVSR